jgi:hypothetical protein
MKYLENDMDGKSVACHHEQIMNEQIACSFNLGSQLFAKPYIL